jgi:nucleotide-binding universal stress UspA family protein
MDTISPESTATLSRKARAMLKDLMVHLDESERTSARLALATTLAQRHKARLTGVFGQRAEALQVGVVASWPPEEYTRAAAVVRARFEQSAGSVERHEWHDVNRGGDAELLRHIVDCARYADLMILGQHDESGHAFVPPELPEAVVTGSGRPALIVPYSGTFADVGHRPLIAWNGSPEAARALNGAIPLIAGCKEAIVLSSSSSYEEAKAASVRVEQHLACHGVAARSSFLVVDEVGVMDSLLNQVTDEGADLLVMGAHGPPGLPSLGRGAGTRHILRHMTVPVLMAA